MTGIIATLGPKSANKETIKELFTAGVDIFRFNFSHENALSASKKMNIIRKIESEIDKNICVMADIQGPGIRTGALETPISYRTGERFKIFTNKNKSALKSLFCDYPSLAHDVRKGGIIKIDAGLMNVKVLAKGEDFVEVKSLNTFVVGSRRHINLPKVHVQLPNITEKDKQDILFAIKEGFEYVALSFVRSGAAVQELRNFLDVNGGKKIKIVSKIENEEGMENIAEIAEKSDIIMVARGDLGTELPIKYLPRYQRDIILETKKKNKKVIVATEMLESMINNPTPTRAEVSDIFYAVLEGTDYVMLSGETAVGKYPIQCVKIMEEVISSAKKSLKELKDTFI